MSGALSNQLIFPTYGQKVKAVFPPPALTFALSWQASTQPATNLVAFPETMAGSFFAYQLALSNIVGEGHRIPMLQSIYIDNSQNSADVVVSISETNVEFRAPAFSVGMYPLISGRSPTLTFFVTSPAEGPTTVDLFAELLPPFVTYGGKGGLVRNWSSTLVAPCPNPCLFSPNDPAVSVYAGTTGAAGAVKQIFEGATTGRMLLSRLEFDVTIGFPSKGTAATTTVQLAFVECLSLGVYGWYYNPILIRNMVLDPSASSANGFYYLPPFNITFDPPYLGIYAAVPGRPLLSPPGKQHLPSLGWIIGTAQNVAYIYINTHCTYGSVPAGNATFSPY